MPTHDETAQFRRDLQTLTPEEREAFKRAVARFVEDLASGGFRPGLRVKRVQGTDGIFEMSWQGADGRATFEFGQEVRAGEPHIVWRRVGGHRIFRDP